MFTFKKSAMKYKDANGVMQDVGAMCSVNETDTTLTKSGVAADAKISGDKLNKANTDITDLNRQIKVERERVNTFTALEEGSTTGDAELEDARIDYEGNTHANVGDHIRSVSNQLSNEIEDLKDEVYFKQENIYEVYKGTSSVGNAGSFYGYILPVLNTIGTITKVTFDGHSSAVDTLHVYILDTEPSTVDDMRNNHIGHGSAEIGTSRNKIAIPITLKKNTVPRYIAFYCENTIATMDYRAYINTEIVDNSRLGFYIQSTGQCKSVGEGNNGRWSPLFSVTTITGESNIKKIEEKTEEIKEKIIMYHTLYVSSTGSDEEGDGTENNPYATIYHANEMIDDNSYYNRYTIKVADGTYTDLQTRYAGTYSGNFEGVLTKDYVEYIGNIENPENVIIQWEGLTGFEADTFVQAMGNDKCPFHVVGSHVSATGGMHTAIRGFTIDAKNIRYAMHIETSGYGKNVDWEISDCIFKWHGTPDMTDKNYQTPTIGTGSGHFEKGKLLRCKIVNDAGITDGFRNHDSRYCYGDKYAVHEGAEITIESCVFDGGASGATNILFRNIYSDNLVDGYNRFNIVNCKGINKLDYQLSGNATVCDWRANVKCSDINDNVYATENLLQ